MDYFTSDTHFGHENIIEYCNRPFLDVAHMNKEMTIRWNHVVGPSDTVYHLGDFAMGKKELWRYYRANLNGKIIFVIGNHDMPRNFPSNQPDPAFLDMLAPDDEWHTNYEYQSEPGSPLIMLKHVPMVYLNHDKTPGQVHVPIQHDLKDKCDYRFCGHIHDAWSYHIFTSTINVGVDVRGFTPHSAQNLTDNYEGYLEAVRPSRSMPMVIE